MTEGSGPRGRSWVQGQESYPRGTISSGTQTTGWGKECCMWGVVGTRSVEETRGLTDSPFWDGHTGLDTRSVPDPETGGPYCLGRSLSVRNSTCTLQLGGGPSGVMGRRTKRQRGVPGSLTTRRVNCPIHGYPGYTGTYWT